MIRAVRNPALPTATPAGEADAGREIYVDPGEVAAAKRARDVQYQTRIVPALRVLGFLLLCFVIGLHGRFGPGQTGVSWADRWVFFALMLGYAALSWLLLDRLYARVRAFNLGTFFLAVDVFFFVGAIHATGGSDSWLFFLLLVRVADQTATTFRNVLGFAHLVVVAYLGMLALDARAGTPIGWPAELVKVASLYVTALYVASTARTAERLRQRGSNAIRDARMLIERLREQTDALAQARTRVEEISRAKSEFFANLGHELRTPLASALGFLDLVLESDLDDEQREHLAHVVAGNRRLQVLLDRLLDFAQLESRTLVVASVPVEIGPLCEGVLAGVAEDAAKKHLELARAHEPGLCVLGDPVRLRQVLTNLLGNAIKFTERGRVELRVGTGAGELTFTVSDTGIGIARDRQATIFELGQVDGSSTRRADGVGLGLALTSRLVAAMGGRLSVDSEPGAGSRFHVTLPLRPALPRSAAHT